MSTAQRFGLLPNDDNTGRNMTYDFQTLAYAATQNVVTQAGQTQINMLLTGATTVNIAVGSSTTPPFNGDQVQFLFAPDSTNRTVTFGTGFAVTASTIVCTASKYASIDFTFNGTVWQETGRAITV